jgi:hypothetical protein
MGVAMKKSLIFTLLCLIVNAVSDAEIQQVVLRWRPLRCEGACINLLDREFSKIHGIDQIEIDSGNGQAIMTWKEKVPFQYSSVSTAMRMVGVSIRDARVKVRGTLRHSGDTFYIVSDGDNTRFDLFNPVIPVQGGVSAEYNASGARNIVPPLKQKLLDAEAQKLTAVIEGPLFMPHRNTIPSQLVIDNISFEEPPQK